MGNPNLILGKQYSEYFRNILSQNYLLQYSDYFWKYSENLKRHTFLVPNNIYIAITKPKFYIFGLFVVITDYWLL